MKLGETLYAADRRAWRRWLAKNHRTKTEIWLVYYRKSSAKPRIPYNDAVEESLCYGWIDSQIKNIDSERFAQRFSARKKASTLSQMNKERVRDLIARGKMTKTGLAAIAHAFDPRKDMREAHLIAPDILRALKADKKAWICFQKFPESYKRIRIAYIEHARRRSKEEFRKRLSHFLKLTARNKLFGFMKD